MAKQRFKVRLFGETLIIPIERNEVMSILQVAGALGVSVETVRRWLRSGQFPRSYIGALLGKADFWLRIDVIEWQKLRYRKDEPTRGRAHFRNLDDIDRQEERRFGRLPIDLQTLLRRVYAMDALLNEDPRELSEQHPNLKVWLKERGSMHRLQKRLPKP